MTAVEIVKKEVIEVGKQVCDTCHCMLLNYTYNVTRTVNNPNDLFTIGEETLSTMKITFTDNIILKWDIQNGYTLYKYYGNENNYTIIRRERYTYAMYDYLYYGDASEHC